MSTIDISVLHDYKARKLLRCQQHSERDLFVWNYMDIVQAKGAWDSITTRTRGLITDSKGNIRAHSFKKFHNIEQNLHTPPNEFTVYEKVDGSLIIVFWDQDQWIVASRGSFTSPQAIFAKELLDTKYNISGLDKSLAYSFEVIYPENRVVVDYKDKKELIFLASFATNGTEVDMRDSIKATGIPIVKQYEFDDYKSIKALNWENCEGFVVRFSNGDRTKVKFQDYLDLHRKVTNLNALSIWGHFSSGKSLESLLEDIPDEFYVWVQNKWNNMVAQFDARKAELMKEYIAIPKNERKEFAIAAAASTNKRELFALFMGQDIAPLIMAALKPVNGLYDVPYNGKVETSDIVSSAPNTKRTNKMIILSGCSGSGKTTWASEYLAANPNTIRVNRDLMRHQLFGYTEDTISSYYTHPSLRQRENAVTRFETVVIRDALTQGLDVLIDNTNLNHEYINRYLTTFPYTEVSLKIMNTPLEVCISRDKERSFPVGEDTIKKQFVKLEKLRNSSLMKKLNNYKAYVAPTITQRAELPKAYIFDIDGTLADCSGRNPFNWTEVLQDLVIQPVKNTLLAHKKEGFKIIICTGRDAICEDKTREWLSIHEIPYDELHMRPRGSTSPDWIIKEKMWSKISESNCIVALYDDRNSVVEHARRCGLTVFQVAEGDF